MFTILYGPPGSGKTSSILEELKKHNQEQKTAYLIVPEQQAFITEQYIYSSLPSQARQFIHVRTFSRLSSELEDRCGGGAFVLPEKSICNLLMWDSIRAYSSHLKAYGKLDNADLTGIFFDELSELTSAGISPDALQSFSDTLPVASPLRSKILDLKAIRSSYEGKLEALCGNMILDRDLRAADYVAQTGFFRDTDVYFDSFTGFTDAQFKLIQTIHNQADNVWITLCLDRLDSSLPQFLESKRIVSVLKFYIHTDFRIASSQSKNQDRNDCLTFLRDHIWSYDLHIEQCRTQPEEAVRLFECDNSFTECENAALEILNLINTADYSFKDIAITVRNTETYAGIIKLVFDKYNIPFFISQRTDLSTKPISRAVLCALSAISNNYPLEDVVNLGKTGLCGVSEDDMDLFSSYCETWRISGRKFTETQTPWSMNPKGMTGDEPGTRGEHILNVANRVREKLIPPLVKMSTRMNSATRLADFSGALYQYLQEIDIRGALKKTALQELEEHHERQAEETIRSYEELLGILITLSELEKNDRVLDIQNITPADFRKILRLMLIHTDIGSVPEVNDCVIIGSAPLLRVENIKAMFLLGLNDGEFPQTISEQGLFSEAEKQQMEKGGIHLLTKEENRLSGELFYLYRAVSKPTEKLFASRALQTSDGKAKSPSNAFTRLLFLLQKNTPRTIHGKDIPQHIQPPKLPVADASTFREQTRRQTLLLSNSKISQYVNCPFSFFASYQLGLNEETSADLSFSGSGTFVHSILEQVLKEFYSDHPSVNPTPSKEEIRLAADRAIAGIFSRYESRMMDPHEDSMLLHSYARLRNQSLLFLDSIFEELSKSDFIPTYFEAKFGFGRKDEPAFIPIELSDHSQLIVRGTADRIDVWDRSDAQYIRIVDYKTGRHPFSLKDVETGKDTQLLLYLFTLCEQQNAPFFKGMPTVPAGANFLYSEKNGSIVRSGLLLDHPDVIKAFRSDYQAQFLPDASVKKGVLNIKNKKSLDEMEQIRDTLHDTLRSIGDRIQSGERNRTPSKNACNYCLLKKRCPKSMYRKEN
ncbi:MAG: exodeoxyribonuclease V subunit gamma [Clostridia bacterium]|nr:exodeoxyribonuclease V subunit gamma [Clostridia bacterium]